MSHEPFSPDVESLRTRLAALMPAVRADLERLVRIPSVSADAFDQSTLETSASTVEQLLRDAGIDDVEILRVEGGRPAVVGRRPGPAGAPTVMLYAHHDVQPPGAEDAWETSAFEPTERDGRLYARGAADDKAGIMAHVAALRLLGDELGVGVVLFIEGEEEIGSPTFTAFLETYRERLAADVIVVADSLNPKVGTPGLTTTLRGLVDGTITVRTLKHAVHSGVFGGAAPDAMLATIRLLDSFWTADGAVAVEGLTASESDAADYPEADFRSDAGVLDGVELIGGGTINSRIWTRPAMSVIGIDAPAVAQSSNTLIPEVRVKFSVRIAPGQDPTAALDAIREHALKNAPFGAQVEVTEGEKGQSFRADVEGPVYDAARWALEKSWGTPSVAIGIGGSIPFVADLKQTYPNASVLITGVEDPDSRAHGANESLHLAEFEKACLAEALLLAALAEQNRDK
ncbi:dipeptidase [Kineosporia succinea]|uniref:Acetylornithine deacetylase/succinyl-diaminopimelate desuccinylase-like protein n=1 Tax=Kineosporia succinea TaxID=84632 RepID=A0ABT9P6A7_9ACTN|nr:dipeptidase [Kineosporia succinea]MDP9828216.1 acetylornithine deacetylase/succinyl-diaminopimelate desuccinylase-like protein [Kineosporia succinea]